MKRILLVIGGVLLSSAAEAAIHTAPVPITTSGQAVCSVVNTSIYPRTGTVTLYGQAGEMLAETTYNLASKQTSQLTFQAAPPPGPTVTVRCSVEGNTNAGEAGIRAALCAVGNAFLPGLSLDSICLDAK